MENCDTVVAGRYGKRASWPWSSTVIESYLRCPGRVRDHNRPISSKSIGDVLLEASETDKIGSKTAVTFEWPDDTTTESSSVLAVP